MKLFNRSFFIAIMIIASLSSACNSNEKSDEATSNAELHEENVTYSMDTTNMNGYIVYDSNDEEKRPGILIVHEWWGMTEYVKTRARQLAQLGYIAMAVDLYGNGQIASDPAQAQALATPFYGNPGMALSRLEAAMAKLKTYNQLDTTQLAAIGYCFGGAMVLNSAKLGADLKGVVSFHGNLVGVPVNKDSIRAAILVCHGEADPLVPDTEVEQFRKQMDSANVDFTFRSYENAQHAFTNPEATEKGKQFNLPIGYNAHADSTSWQDMKNFFNTIFKN